MKNSKDDLNDIDSLFPMLDAVISVIDEGVIISDKKGNVLFNNPSVIKLLDLKPGKKLTKLQQIGDLNLQRELLKQSTDCHGYDETCMPLGEFITFDTKILQNDGIRYIEFHSGIVKCQINDKDVRLILIRDKTEQRILEAAYKTKYTDIISNDPKMLEVVEKVHTVAASHASVLVQGESGTGKTLIASMVHQLSSRSSQPFIEVNCAAIPEALFESELFGHTKGAVSGASSEQQGRIQAANNGTLFLDEVSEIPLQLQTKLLRAIQEQEYVMVGSDKTMKVNVRIISASNQNIRKLVDQGKFRADLYYRLAVIPLIIPPLRHRPGDIPLLTKHFCERLVARGYPTDVEVDPLAFKMMMDYPWPGNVRELENAVEHGVLCAVDKTILAESLPHDITQKMSSTITKDRTKSTRLIQSHEINSALALAKGSKSEAAKIIGIDRTTLWRRMQKLGID